MTNVLSLFDGLGCARLALERAGIQVDKYYSSEIDPHAIKVSRSHWKDTVELGDINDWENWNLPHVDVIVGGSPCQSFSRAGDGAGFDGKSSLFFKYVEVLNYYKPKYFLLENVVMKKEWQDVISKALGVEPTLINSSKLSAQTRPRLYWANFPITQPEDKGILLKDILDENPDPLYNISDKGKVYLERAVMNQRYINDVTKRDKSTCVVANFCKGVPYNVLRDKNGNLRHFTPEECEKLQTLPKNFTKEISKTQRYKSIGNGWTVDVVAHIFKQMKLCGLELNK